MQQIFLYVLQNRLNSSIIKYVVKHFIILGLNINSILRPQYINSLNSDNANLRKTCAQKRKYVNKNRINLIYFIWTKYNKTGM